MPEVVCVGDPWLDCGSVCDWQGTTSKLAVDSGSVLPRDPAVRLVSVSSSIDAK